MDRKKLLITLIILMFTLAMIILTGCGAKKETAEEAASADESLVKINGLEFHLDQEKEFKGIKYIISGDFAEVDHDMPLPYIQYNYYQEDSTNLLFFRVFYYEGKNFDYAINDLGIEDVTLSDGKTDNVEYQFFAQPREDGGTINYYFINKDGNTYVVNFISKYDIKDFEQKVMNSIKF